MVGQDKLTRCLLRAKPSNSFMPRWIKFIFIHILSLISCTWSIPYSWLQYNDLYDCMVGLSVDGKPISSGIIVHPCFLIAAANPIERYPNHRVKIHVINGHYGRQKVLPVSIITRNQNQRNSKTWFTLGHDNLHNPCHDLIIITSDGVLKHRDNVEPPGNGRYGRICPRVYTQAIGMGQRLTITSGKLTYAGFGFIDKPHIKQNVELELVEYDEDLEDCSEWIPITWGNFICLKNTENFVGISSGAGLFLNDKLIGIGSFAVKRGNEGILVFTDIRRYHPYKMFIFVYPRTCAPYW